MISRSIVVLLSALISVSFFFNWFTLAGDVAVSPLGSLTPMFQESVTDLPVIPAIFIATFIFAVINTFVGLLGHCSRGLTAATGILPIALYFIAAPFLADFGLPFSIVSLELSIPGIVAFAQSAVAAMELGGWMYFGGALGLIILVMLDPGRDQSYGEPVSYYRPPA